MDVRDAKVLVTGGARGIGLALTERWLADGASVIAVGRDASGLAALLERYPDRVQTIAADLSDAAEVDTLIARLIRDHADLDMLVNNAGVQYETDLVGGDPNTNLSWARAEIALNMNAVISLCTALPPGLAARPQAAIVNVTSGLAFAPKQAAPTYCATKAGVLAFTQALRYQCERSAGNVQVCEAVLPLVDTDMTRGRGRGKITPKAAADQIAHGVANGRDEILIGKSKLLPALLRIAPSIPRRMLRSG